jgi:hypothetical protein
MLDKLETHQLSFDDISKFMTADWENSHSFWAALHNLFPYQIHTRHFDASRFPKIIGPIQRAIPMMSGKILQSLDLRLPTVRFRKVSTYISTVAHAPVAHFGVAAEELETYGPDKQSDPARDSNTLFELIQSDDTAVEARYDGALELASRSPEQLRLFDYIINTLNHRPPDSPWVHACVGISEDLQVIDPSRRVALAAGLMRVAKQLRVSGPREVMWIALCRWNTLVPTADLPRILDFMAPGTEPDTVQVALQCVWNSLSIEREVADLPELLGRSRELLSKYLDVDWLTLPRTRALTADALLAFSTLAPEPELQATFDHARRLGQHFPWRLVRSNIERMHEHARTHQLDAPRLSLLETMTRN